MNIFLPNHQANSIYDLNPTIFLNEGIRGIVVDLDNTLVPWNVSHATDEVIQWLNSLTDAGLSVIIFSNNDEQRVEAFAKPLGIPFIHRAKKPLQGAFKRARNQMGISSGQLAVIGDQLLTDILGGNLSGAYTILVVPIVNSDARVTKFNRFIEKLILNYFKKRGKQIRGAIDE